MIERYYEIDGIEYTVKFDYNAHYRRAKISGPPEDWYPEDGEMEFSIASITPEVPMEKSLTFNEMIDQDTGEIEQECWEDFFDE